MLRLFKLLQDGGEHILPQREILYKRIPVDGESAAALEILDKPPLAGLLPAQIVHGLRVLPEKGPHLLRPHPNPLRSKADLGLNLHKDIEKHAKYRNNHHRHNPGQLEAGIHGLIENGNDHQRAEEHTDKIYDMGVVLHPQHQADQKSNLQKQRKDYKGRPAKDNAEKLSQSFHILSSLKAAQRRAASLSASRQSPSPPPWSAAQCSPSSPW